MDEDEEQFQADMAKVDEIIWEEVFPVLDRIEDDFPDQSAFFNMFVSAMHVVFAQGWTKAELLQEVENHHQIFVENAGRGDSPLH